MNRTAAAALFALSLIPPVHAEDNAPLAALERAPSAAIVKPVCPVVKKGYLLGDSVSQAWRSGSTIPFYAANCAGYTRGDFVVFVPVTSTTRYIKKVAALPGDVVSFDEAGALIVNGEPILQGPDRRPYHPTDRTAAARFTGVVPRHDVIMISDADRAHSTVTEQDFSVFGLVNVRSIEFVARVPEQQQAAMGK